MPTFTATYSPDDNKLRLYASQRLDAETYARAKALGFKWAPKQDLFFAPMWTPQREDFLTELAGEIDDEDSSLVDRAEERAERFEDYSEKRLAEAKRAEKAVAAIADGIPLGQPILVGHHSERRARKDAERIENGMRKAVKLWKTSTYWTDRAAGAIHAAKYKERPDVRGRRIKGLESDLRKEQKNKKEAEAKLAFWSLESLTLAQAKHFSNSNSFYVARKEGDAPGEHFRETAWGALDKLEKGEPSTVFAPRTLEEVIEQGRKLYPRVIAGAERWIEHFQNRLAYERAMLAEQIGAESHAERFAFEVGGKVSVRRDGATFYTIIRVNKAGGVVSSLTLAGRRYVPVVGVEEVTDYKAPDPETVAKVKKANALPPMCNYPGEGFVHVTRAQWDRVHKDYKGSEVIKGTETHGRHRVRRATASSFPQPEGAPREYGLKNVFITDEKRKDAPPPDVDMPTTPKPERAAPEFAPRPAPEASPEDEGFKQLESALRAGVQVVSAPQLFPTPVEIAQEMVDLAEIEPGHKVLEPSAGTGRLIGAMGGRMFDHNPERGEVRAVELNYKLADQLRASFPLTRVVSADFLSIDGPDDLGVPLGEFDRIVMNPPFENGADIRHIQHARTFLKPGGRLVALCANGPRQQAALRPLAKEWRALPPNSFAESGTGVNVALLVIEA
jgi:protein-L-isoaspartate O-methyltransferase